MPPTIADAIRDVLVTKMREDLTADIKSIKHCVKPKIAEMECIFYPESENGIRLDTNRGVFDIKVTVTKVG